jgi:hypothetical protein
MSESMMHPEADADPFEPLFETAFDVDSERLERSDAAVLDDRIVALLRRDNRIALRKGRTRRLTPADGAPGVAYYDVPLVCVAHSHPECRFRWSRLLVDLSPTRGALISDMAPRQVDGEGPIEIETSLGIGLKFELAAKAVTAQAEPAYRTKRTVYYPRVTASGAGFSRGYWDFLALTSDYLHADRELRLLVAAPEGEAVDARFRLSAKVAMAGLARLIPLISRTAEIDRVWRLD